MTAEQMHEIVRVRMVELRFPRFLAKLLANSVYELRRWTTPVADPLPATPVPIRK
jgi:hypothetical protein